MVNQTPKKIPKKIWLSLSTPFQVNFFYHLIKRLKNQVDLLVTARDHDNIIPMLEAKGIEYIKVGKHGGKKLQGRLMSYADTIKQLIPIVEREQPDLLITERWPEAVRTAFGFNIPSWTIFYDEREFHVNWMTFPLSTKIFAPSFYTPEDLKSQGVVDLSRVVWFKGFHTCYLKDSKIDRNKNPLADMDLDPPYVIVRPEPEFASFFQERRRRILEETVKLIIKKRDASIIVFPRTEEQASRFPKDAVNIFNSVTFECPVAYANVTLGAAETMLMESFVLGTPTISAIYWKPAKPVTELHKYIPHSIDPIELAKETVSFFDSENSNQFRKMAKTTIERMENPVDKMIEEIERLFDPKSKPTKTRRRSSIDMITDVIRCLSYQSLIFSHLMQKVNVTYKQLKSDLKLLAKKDYIETFVGEDGGVYYRATAQGLQVLEEYEKVKNNLS